MAISPITQLPGGALTVNEQFFDALVRHQIGLMRLSGSIRKDVFKLLDATEADMADKIRGRLAGHRGLNTPASVQRMQRLIKVLKSTRLTAWRQVTEVWVKEMRELSKVEPALIDGALKTVVPVVLETTLPTASRLQSIVATHPFEGKTLSQWAKNIAQADVSRIESQIKIGMVQGESSQAIARRVVGSVSRRGVDGATEITRRQAAAVTRTAVTAISNQAKRAYYVANEKLFQKELYVATLDNRTTNICMSLDGNKFPIGEGPYPPVHFACRSLRIAIIDDEVIGQRPSKPFSERQLVKEFTKKQGLKGVTNRSNLPRGTKGEFDKFARVRKRELTGQVPAKVNYGTWLKRQSRGFQDDVLGKTKGRLFRKGGLKLDKFVNRAGDEIPLSQLARTDAAAFRAAGLNPEKFL